METENVVVARPLLGGQGNDKRDDTSMTYVTPSMRSNGDAHSGFKDEGGIVPQQGVRRLLPLECERLQCWPENHTQVGIDEELLPVEMSDSARYKMIGNGVTSSVGEWIGRGIPL